MRKWTYLVATLLMAGTTATFTGCIDTDEPEGIVDLRGAKSELIKAQAAVKLVEVEWQKAQVARHGGAVLRPYAAVRLPPVRG